jgi:hypothetical protein
VPAKRRPRAAAKPSRKPARKAAAKLSRKAAAKPSRKPARKAAKPAPKPARRTRSRRVPKPKPAARSATRSGKPRRRTAGIATLPIPPAKTRRARKPRKPKAPQGVPSFVFEDRPAESAGEAPPAEAAGAIRPAEVTDGEQTEARRYVAIVSEIEGAEPFPAQEAPLFPTAREREGIDTYPTDIPIAVTAALLAVTVFFRWYIGPSGFPVSVTGWQSGSLAPLILFLALGSVALVVLRRVGVAVSLPVEESLAHEAVGWLSLVAAVVKSRMRPSVAGLGLGTSYGVWIAIIVAALLVLLAGRMSPRAPLVVRPGWQRGRAGTIGLAVLLVVIAGSAVFGATNGPKQPTASAPNPDLFKGTVRGKIPKCAKGFPFPSGLKPEYGFDTGSSCQAQLSSTRKSTDLIKAFRAALKAGKWTFTEVKGQPGSAVFSITKPRCATLAVIPAEKGAAVAIAFTPCPTTRPTPRSTRS